MKILEVKSLAMPDVKVITFARFKDQRGYFMEHFQNEDFQGNPELAFLKGLNFVQANESYSRPKVFRGFHFQWNPYMGKLIRPIFGYLIDLALDLRKNSSTFGKVIAYEMSTSREREYDEWIWLPPGFAHGVLFPKEESLIEYFCSGRYSPGCEAGISPFADDIDWSICNPELKKIFDSVLSGSPLMADKDRNAYDLSGWLKDEKSDNFIYGKL